MTTKKPKKPQTFRLWLDDGPIVTLGKHPFYKIYGGLHSKDNMCVGTPCELVVLDKQESCLESRLCAFLPLEV